jgi:hypothetical protein
MRVRGIVSAATALTLFVAITSSALAWAPWVNGQPPQLGAGAEGYFVWHNDDGWHMRTHATPAGRVFNGRLHTDGTFVDVQPVRAESTEQLAVVDGGRTLVFRLVTFDHYDGIDFRIDGGTHLRAYLEQNGLWSPRRDIYIGGAGTHPLTNPFTLWR